jgi:hypothetical protein
MGPILEKRIGMVLAVVAVLVVAVLGALFFLRH